MTITSEHDSGPLFTWADEPDKQPISVKKQPVQSRVNSGLMMAEMKALIATPSSTISALLADLDPFQAVLKDMQLINADKALENALAPLIDLDIMSEVNAALRGITRDIGQREIGTTQTLC